MMINTASDLLEIYHNERPIFPGMTFVDLLGGTHPASVTGHVVKKQFVLGDFDDPAAGRIREAAMKKLTESGRFRFDGDLLRMMSLEVSSSGDIVMGLQPAKYSDQVKSGLSLDLKDEQTGVSMRDLLLREYPGKFPPVTDARLALTLGSSICLFTPREAGSDELVPILVGRSKNTAIMNDGLNLVDSASGVFDAPPGVSEITEVHIRDGILNECLEELGVAAHEIEQLQMTGLAGEMARPGKPQFFWTGIVGPDYAHMRDRIHKHIASQRPQDREVTGLPECPLSILDITPDNLADFASRNRVSSQAAISTLLGATALGIIAKPELHVEMEPG